LLLKVLFNYGLLLSLIRSKCLLQIGVWIILEEILHLHLVLVHIEHGVGELIHELREVLKWVH